MDGDLSGEFDRAVNAIAQFKHGKLDEQSANPLRAVQILANVTHRAFGENPFGMFQHVEKQRLGTKYEGAFRVARGRPPFLTVKPYSGAASFSNNETYIFDANKRRALPLEPLILWETCEQHPDSENGHCFLFDAAEADGSFTYKAVGHTCVLKVSPRGSYAALAERLAVVCDRDGTIAAIQV